MCLSYKCSTYGWVAICTPVLGLDGYHLKKKYRGVGLAIVELNVDNGTFSLAMHVCRKEDKKLIGGIFRW